MQGQPGSHTKTLSKKKKKELIAGFLPGQLEEGNSSKQPREGSRKAHLGKEGKFIFQHICFEMPMTHVRTDGQEVVHVSLWMLANKLPLHIPPLPTQHLVSLHHSRRTWS